MRLVLITGEDCDICADAETKFRRQYKRELEKGEAMVTNIDEDENMQRLWMKHDYPIPPTIIVVTNENRLITVVDAVEFLEDLDKAIPVGGAPPAVTAAVGVETAPQPKS